MSAARITGLLEGSEEQRGQAYAKLASLAAARGSAREDATAVACDCMAPLVNNVLCADASQVGGAEARQAFLLLGSLLQLETFVAQSLARDGCWLAAWNAPGTALAAAISKTPADLTREDVMLMAADVQIILTMWAIGPITQVFQPVGISQLPWYWFCASSPTQMHGSFVSFK